jgi:acetyl/propionyl-CoA carboxylase alpha subunit
MDKLKIGPNSFMVNLRRSGTHFTIEVDDEVHEGNFTRKVGGAIELVMNDSRTICFSERRGNEIYVFINGINYVISRESSGIKGIVDEEESDDSVSSPITGKLLDVKMRKGDKVSQGDVIVILEAMKMEHRLKAPRDGVLSKLTSVAIGGQIKEGELMFELETK